MAISKITTGSIEDGTLSTADLADGASYNTNGATGGPGIIIVRY